MTGINYFPITQFTHVHAAQENLNALGGGSQDNGMSITTDGGVSWFYRQGGDGSTLSIDPNDNSRMWSIVGVYNGDLTFRRHRSTDGGVTWTDVNAGIDPADQWYTELHNDQVNPVWLYSNAGSKVYQSQDYGDAWTTLGTFTKEVRSLRVGRYSNPSAAIWAVLDTNIDGNRVHVFDGSAWNVVESGLPSGVKVRAVIPHPTEPNTAYALINGIGNPGQKVYRTFDRGTTWTNVSGNLPDVPLGGIVGHPTNPNLLYLGTEMGCFQGEFDGATWSWSHWDAGLPTAAISSDMSWTDLLDESGDFWILLGTYGRSMYRREVQDLEPAGIADDVEASRLELAQNAPNPVRSGETTRIRFSTPKSGTVELGVYDVSGREVTSLLDGFVDAGAHEYDLSSAGLAPGVYFYRLRAGSWVESRKLTIE
ncbi:MAG: T9SS type A sorting domain-containing protein [Candidatus Eisenbacteria bacterium]